MGPVRSVVEPVKEVPKLVLKFAHADRLGSHQHNSDVLELMQFMFMHSETESHIEQRSRQEKNKRIIVINVKEKRLRKCTGVREKKQRRDWNIDLSR